MHLGWTCSPGPVWQQFIQYPFLSLIELQLASLSDSCILKCSPMSKLQLTYTTSTEKLPWVAKVHLAALSSPKSIHQLYNTVANFHRPRTVHRNLIPRVAYGIKAYCQMYS